MPGLYVLLLLLTSFLWGSNFVFSKFLVGHASPLTITTLRWLIATIILLPIIWKKERRLLPPKTALFPLFLMGLTGVVLFNIFQFLALERTSASNTGLISTLNPISIAIFSALLLKDRLKAAQVGSMCISFLGVLVVLSKGDIKQLMALHFNSGDLWMVAAVVIWGLYSIFSKLAMKVLSPMEATFYSGIIGIIILLPFNAGSFEIVNVSPPFLLSLFYSGIVSTVICMILWNMGVQKIGATSAGIFLNFNPIFTAILAFLFLGEQMTISQLAGSIVVISGCFLFSHFSSMQQTAQRNSQGDHTISENA